MIPSIQMINGRYFNYVEPEFAHADIRTIAHALAHVCRFGGHTKRFYSVAQHCVLMVRMAESESMTARELMLLLMHDCAEAFLGDMPSPLKMLHPTFAAQEARIEEGLYERFNIPLPSHSEKILVKWYDMRMLSTEKRDIMPQVKDDLDWGLQKYPPASFKIRPWPPFYARWQFMRAYRRLARQMVHPASVMRMNTADCYAVKAKEPV